MISKMLRIIRDVNASVAPGYRIPLYVLSGRRPWSKGYVEYKRRIISRVLDDEEILGRFLKNKELPLDYGLRIDERVVEYPWVLSRLLSGKHRLLDAGSALNFPYILDYPRLQEKSIVIYTLAPEATIGRANVSYIYGDLRRTILRDAHFDAIVCISTIEHIGMDNTLIYTSDRRYDESAPYEFLDTIKEFKRLLKPEGKLFITVPYGRPQDIDWLQQFDQEKVDLLVDAFGGDEQERVFYRYDANGWQLSDASACSECEYYDIHTRKAFDPDYAAAARAVVCLQLKK